MRVFSGAQQSDLNAVYDSPETFVYALTDFPCIVHAGLCVFELNDTLLQSIVQSFQFFDLLHTDNRLVPTACLHVNLLHQLVC